MEKDNIKWHLGLLNQYLLQYFSSFGKPLTAQNVKCAILFNQPCLARPRFIDLNPDELCYQPFMVSLDRYSRDRRTFYDLSPRLCVPNEARCKYNRYLV